MTDKPSSARARQLRLLDAGICTRCAKPRTAESGHTADRCAACSEKNRVKSRERMRKKRGTPIDLPLVPRARGPRPNLMSTANRSDEYAPENYKPLRSGRRKPGHAAQPGEPRKSKRYGSLSREDIRAATSALPLRPPGK